MSARVTHVGGSDVRQAACRMRKAGSHTCSSTRGHDQAAAGTPCHRGERMRVALFRLRQEAVGKCEKTAGPRGELRHAI
jgi:hypothetical protein